MFAHSSILWLLLLMPLVAGFWQYRRWAQGRALQRLGNPFRIKNLLLLHPRRRWMAQAGFSMALTLLILGLAGPQWGREPVEARSVRRDLMVVLDVSRSMLAEQPSRLERAVRALEHLNETIGKRGEVRMGLVLYAAYPRLQLPPSLNVDHFHFLLQRVRTLDLPPELWKGPKDAASGTRIGAALTRAAALYQPAPGRSFEILLVSDGHDPVNDDEWQKGVQTVRDNIPVHVLAIGDPARGYPIPPTAGGDGSETKLNESLLQDIARQTRGVYLPGHTLTQIPLGSLLSEVLAQGRVREASNGDTSLHLTQPVSRQFWFYLAAFIMMTTSLLLNDARSPAKPVAAAGLVRRGSKRAHTIALAMLALFLVSAAPSVVDDYLRLGNEAYTQKDYKQALEWYAKAEWNALDPGLVAFNKGSALYQLGRPSEAALHFERCLEDDAAPLERRQKALYDLGTARLKASPQTDPEQLKQAVEAFRACLELAPPEVLREDARYNLELAQLLWLKAASTSKDKDGENPGQKSKSKNDNHKGGTEPKTSPKEGKNADKSDSKTQNKGLDKIEGKDKTETPGSLQVSPEEAPLKEYSSDEMQKFLRLQVDRIARDRQSARREAWRNLVGVPNH